MLGTCFFDPQPYLYFLAGFHGLERGMVQGSGETFWLWEDGYGQTISCWSSGNVGMNPEIP